MKRVKIALVGDFDKNMYTHVALNDAIEHARAHLPFTLNAKWVQTEDIEKALLNGNNFHGFWIAPGSPYKNDEGVYKVIRMAREMNLPIIGSCGGFQYMVLEYARNVLNLSNAGHEESDPNANPVISKLSCSLKGQREEVHIPDSNSWLYQVFKTDKIIGKYYCSYGVNPLFQEKLNRPPFLFTAFSATGEVRAFELRTHRFFKGTLFQPALDSSIENPNPLILDFFKACT